jgi:CBS domain-containing protein
MGYLPVVKAERLVGLVTKSAMLRYLAAPTSDEFPHLVDITMLSQIG